MLCGPPGTGKTTLAHVAARHCGYRAVEINASDDRSPEALRELLSRATQSTTLDADKRPNCIIFDEADGIADTAKHSLDILLDVIKAPLSAGSKTNKNKKKGSKDKTKEGGSNAPFALTRPLIIICNDQYAPVLRELKQLAEVFVFQAPSEMRLVQRLKHICALEGIHIRNASLLSELIHVTGHDIRSTINNLQFAAMRLKQQDRYVQDAAEVDLGDVVTSMMNMGLKDDNLDSFQVLQRIFTSHLACTTSNAPASSKGGTAAKEKKSEMMTAIDCMQHHGDYDHLIHGMHENLHQTAADHSTTAGGEILSRFAYSADWLSMSDVMMTSMRNLSDGFQLMPHVALTAGAVHMSHAITISGGSQSGGSSSHNALGGNNSSGMKLQWPKKDREAHFARLQRMNVLQALQEQQAQHQHRSPENKENIAMDYASALLDVFVPKVRQLPMLSLSPQEREVVLEVAQRMESCGVSYIPMAVVDRPDGGNNKYQGRGNKQYAPKGKNQQAAINTESIFLQDRVEFQLEPSLELLVTFDQVKCDELAGRHASIPQDVRAIVYQEQRQLSISQKV